MRIKSAAPLFWLMLTMPSLAAAPQAELRDRFHVRGRITLEGKAVAGAAVGIRAVNVTTYTNADGSFDLYPVKRGEYELSVVHPEARPQELKVFIKRDFRIEHNLVREIPAVRSERLTTPFFTAPSASYDSGATIEKAVSIFGLSPQYYSTLPGTAKLGALFEPPVVRSQNPMNNGYMVDGLVLDMPFHSLGVYSTTNLRQVDAVSVHRGVYGVTERDTQGGALIETVLPAGRDARNGFDLYLTPLIADATGHYQLGDKASGSVTVRRMLVDTYVESDTLTIPAPIDYQSRNFWQFDPRTSLEVVALGAHDALSLTASQKFAMTTHAQKVRVARRDGKILYSLDLKNRYFSRDVVVFSESKQIVSAHPQIGWYFAPDQYAAAGVDLFYEGRSAALALNQGVNGVNVDQFKQYITGTHDSGYGINFGGFLQYRGKFGRFGIDASSRFDKYREYEAFYSANAVQLYMDAHRKLRLYAAGANMHRRPDAYKSLALISSPALAPESNYKTETGATFTPLSFLKISATLFYTRWMNLIALRSDTASLTDLTNTYLFRNAGNSENVGSELSALIQRGSYYVRSSYTYQHMPQGDNYSFYYRRHIGNLSFIYTTSAWSHTVQLRVWSQPGDIEGAKSDALNPSVGLDYRFTYTSASGLYFTFEIGQLLNLPYKYLAIPRRSEYYDAAALANSMLGASARGTASDELPLHLNIALGLRL